MIIEGYSQASEYYDLKCTRFVANKAGTGFAKNDVLERKITVNLADNTEVAASEKWFNITQGGVLLGAIPAAADVTSLETDAILGAETLAVSSTAVALTPSAGAVGAVVHVLDADIIFTLEGTAPVGNGAVAPVGFRQADAQTFELNSPQELAGFQAMRLDAVNDARIYVEYHCVERSGN